MYKICMWCHPFEMLVLQAGEFVGIATVCVYGGVPKNEQRQALKRGIQVCVYLYLCVCAHCMYVCIWRRAEERAETRAEKGNSGMCVPVSLCLCPLYVCMCMEAC